MSATHEIHQNTNGTFSLKHLASGEVMHSSIGPEAEARMLYVEQSRLAERLTSTPDSICIWDVGLGAGTNALASIACAYELKLKIDAGPRLEIVSFESDISGARLALENRTKIPFLERFGDPMKKLLETGTYQDEVVHWTLFDGDFRNSLAGTSKVPNIIYFDFYSPKVNPELWGYPVFLALTRQLEKLCNQTPDSPRTDFFTYSASTRVRSALLASGFFVGFGRSTGAKNDTTIASTDLSGVVAPLAQRWFEKFLRSPKKIPHGWLGTDEELIALVQKHPQFSGS